MQRSSHDIRVIEPVRGLELPRPRELWAYRDLAYFLIRRDVLVRYKQTAIGATWAILQPLGLAVVFSLFLGELANMPSAADIPYPLYAFSGLVLWLLVTNGLQNAAGSTLRSEDLITKVYFPRVILPLAATVPAVIDFAFAFVVVLLAMAAYGYAPGLELVLLPLPVILALLLSAGAGLVFSAVMVRYRDVQLLIPFLVLVGLFMTPVMYPFSLVPEGLQAIYALNPVAGVLELFRYVLFGQFTAPVWTVGISAASALVLFGVGILYFNRRERGFADVI